MKQITIDCTPIETRDQLHTAIAEALHFPDWYGRNLDAMYDCLTDMEGSVELTLHNWHALEYRLGDYSGKLVYVFHCACEENTDLKVMLIP